PRKSGASPAPAEQEPTGKLVEELADLDGGLFALAIDGLRSHRPPQSSARQPRSPSPQRSEVRREAGGGDIQRWRLRDGPLRTNGAHGEFEHGREDSVDSGALPVKSLVVLAQERSPSQWSRVRA